MTVVTTHYRPKRAPRKKRKQQPIASRIVTPAPLKPIKGPVIRLSGRMTQPPTQSDDPTTSPKRSAVVEPKRKRTSIFGAVPDMTEGEHQRRSDAAGELWRELVRRATSDG